MSSICRSNRRFICIYVYCAKNSLSTVLVVLHRVMCINEEGLWSEIDALASEGVTVFSEKLHRVESNLNFNVTLKPWVRWRHDLIIHAGAQAAESFPYRFFVCLFFCQHDRSCVNFTAAVPSLRFHRRQKLPLLLHLSFGLFTRTVR